MARRFFCYLRQNALGFVAIVIALGGTAYAAAGLPRNSVGTRQLKNGAVTAGKLHNGAVTGAKVANDSLTGQQIDAATLGTVPSATNATNLGGSPGSSYVKSPVGPAQLGALPAVRVTNSTPLSLTNHVLAALPFDTNEYDNSGIHSTTVNATRLTAPISGIYAVTGNVDWNSNATGIRELFIRENGTALVAATFIPASALYTLAQEVTTQVQLNAGDYVELAAYQDSGGALSVFGANAGIAYSPIFAMHWLGP